MWRANFAWNVPSAMPYMQPAPGADSAGDGLQPVHLGAIGEMLVVECAGWHRRGGVQAAASWPRGSCAAQGNVRRCRYVSEL